MSASGPELGTLELPFRLRERAGVVRVEVVSNTDPEEIGHPLVAVGYDAAAFRGFPIVQADVAYEGSGALAWMGWLQVIVRTDDDGAVYPGVDVAGLFGDECPLYVFGFKPTFSDFPANPTHPDGNWVADAFLVAIPDVVRSRVLDLVAGFRWGYRLQAGRAVERFSPTPLGVADWNAHLPLLASEYPTWTCNPAS